MNLTPAQLDRACGVLLGATAGDALGAGYEFEPPLPADADVAMIGGGPFGWQPGEWTDDTAMAIAIAETAATGADLRLATAQDEIVGRWQQWADTAKDVGAQTRHVLSRAERGDAASATLVARQLHVDTHRTAGNGSLMRTAPVALAYLDDPEALVEAATVLSALTHYDPDAGEACALWCLAIRHAVLTGECDARVGLCELTSARRDVWSERLVAAGHARPADFPRNGWVVEALQAAWCAISTMPRPEHDATDPTGLLPAVLRNAVRGGNDTDTDTVAAIAGALIGAACGASAVPSDWASALHGWPGLTANELVELAASVTQNGA